jgi:hypothetical protein
VTPVIFTCFVGWRTAPSITSFSGDGIVSYAASVYVERRRPSLRTEPSWLQGPASNDGFVARVLADGTFDPDFSTDGFATVASLGLGPPSSAMKRAG